MTNTERVMGLRFDHSRASVMSNKTLIFHSAVNDEVMLEVTVAQLEEVCARNLYGSGQIVTDSLTVVAPGYHDSLVWIIGTQGCACTDITCASHQLNSIPLSRPDWAALCTMFGE